MTTRNTLEDLSFAEMHLDYMARRSSSEKARAEAQTLTGVIRLLDHHRPAWREQLLVELSSRELYRQVQDMLVADLDYESLMNEYLAALVNVSKGKP